VGHVLDVKLSFDVQYVPHALFQQYVFTTLDVSMKIDEVENFLHDSCNCALMFILASCQYTFGRLVSSTQSTSTSTSTRSASTSTGTTVQVPRLQVQVPITPDQVQPKYWSMDSETALTTGTQIGQLIEFYSTEK